MKPFQIQDFLNQIKNYREVLDRWGVIDAHLDDLSEPIVNTFLNKFNDSSYEILTNTLNDLKVSFSIKDNYYVTKTSE